MTWFSAPCNKQCPNASLSLRQQKRPTLPVRILEAVKMIGLILEAAKVTNPAQKIGSNGAILARTAVATIIQHKTDAADLNNRGSENFELVSLETSLHLDGNSGQFVKSVKGFADDFYFECAAARSSKRVAEDVKKASKATKKRRENGDGICRE